jgi:hypothetical protein
VHLSHSFSDYDQARQFTARCAKDEETRESLVADAIRVLNRAIRVSRVSARDPYLIEITRSDPFLLRIGWGEPEATMSGAWKEAIEVPAPKQRRLSRGERIAPSRTVAMFLAKQAPVIEAHDLLLRAVLEHDQGNERAAAVLLHAAAILAMSELNELGHENAQNSASCIEMLLDETSRLAATGRRASLDVSDNAQIRELVGSIHSALAAVYAQPETH